VIFKDFSNRKNIKKRRCINENRDTAPFLPYKTLGAGEGNRTYLDMYKKPYISMILRIFDIILTSFRFFVIGLARFLPPLF